MSERPNDDHDGDTTERRRRFLRTSTEQKELLITLVQVDGRSIREAAQIVGINESTARNIVSAFRREGAIIHRHRGGSNALKLTPEALQRIEESVERHPDDTLLQTQQRLREQGINLAVSSVYNALMSVPWSGQHTHVPKFWHLPPGLIAG
ncbi:unnamed protein product [Heligmosomoides polygyrus]|uniref:Transposase n=1 Tax=Heligmosomoides polygyrus TaxID=6339 RepID=A0A3P7YDA0_HELPZ|nr:unnamed protein product [Heligmosomoides polygyrus]